MALNYCSIHPKHIVMGINRLAHLGAIENPPIGYNSTADTALLIS
uniref:Uncharacterized protein n=1 Tax=Anguilla anguilla TaxID=7936 RepID=A0A0E9XA46_ANGAN